MIKKQVYSMIHDRTSYGTLGRFCADFYVCTFKVVLIMFLCLSFPLQDNSWYFGIICIVSPMLSWVLGAGYMVADFKIIFILWDPLTHILTTSDQMFCFLLGGLL